MSEHRAVQQGPNLIPIGEKRAAARARARRVEQAIHTRRRLRAASSRSGVPERRRGGRAWINGAEVGGTDDRYLHLMASFD